MTKLRMMSIRFSTALSGAELPLFRGAVIASAGRENDFFHNHSGEGFAYRYPLVQYRNMGGKAGLVCLNEGIEQTQRLLGGDFLLCPVRFGGREERVVVEDMRINEFELCLLDTTVEYHISRWLPFSQENYRLWQSLGSAEERVAMLGRILVGNIISFAKGVGWQIEGRVEVSIEESSIEERHTLYKGRQLVSLSCDFCTNLFLPRGIALGKGVSLNRGVISSRRS